MSKNHQRMPYAARLLRVSVFALSVAVGIAAWAPRASAAEVAELEVTLAQASRSESGVHIDKALLFAKTGLLRTGYNTFTYVRQYSLRLAKGNARKISLGREVSIVIGLTGFVGPGDQRIQYYLETYRGKKRQARVHYSVSRGGVPAITGIDQPGGQRAHVVIVRAPK
jgi:hypothetical protein